MTQPLIAVGKRGLNGFHFHRPIPFGRRRHRSVIGAEPDQIGLRTEHLAAKLAQIVLPPPGHFSRFGVADVGVVRPDDGLAVRTVEREQILQRIEHMAVAQIP